LVGFGLVDALKDFHNKTPFFLCLMGGILLILSGASGSIALAQELSDDFGLLFGSEFVISFEIIMGILGLLTSMTGLAVIVGGLVLTTQRVESGRNIVLVAVGTGVLGLVMALIQSAMAGRIMMDLGLQVTQSLAWIGAILALQARIIAEQKPMMMQ
jgi:hypothetical protein